MVEAQVYNQGTILKCKERTVEITYGGQTNSYFEVTERERERLSINLETRILPIVSEN
jgi:hypothetical protein